MILSEASSGHFVSYNSKPYSIKHQSISIFNTGDKTTSNTKRLVIEKEKVGEAVLRIYEEGFCSFKLFFANSKEHERNGILPDRVLIRAWQRRGRNSSERFGSHVEKEEAKEPALAPVTEGSSTPPEETEEVAKNE